MSKMAHCQSELKQLNCRVLHAIFKTSYLHPSLFWAIAVYDPDLWSLELPKDFSLKINKTSLCTSPFSHPHTHTSRQQIQLMFVPGRNSSFPQNLTCLPQNRTAQHPHTIKKREDKKNKHLTQSNTIIQALTDGCWRCVNIPKWNNHFYPPCVHIRCHTTGQDCSRLLGADVGRGNYLDTVARERGSVESLILFEHGSGPLYYMQGNWQSNGIFDQRRRTNTAQTLRA